MYEQGEDNDTNVRMDSFQVFCLLNQAPLWHQ